MKKINKLFTTLFIFTLIFSSCNTDDLDPSLEQSKSVEGSIKTISDVEGIIKGAYNVFTGSGYYGRDFIINGEVRSDNCFSNGNSGRFTTQATLAYNANTGFMFDDAYRAIAIANIVIATDIGPLTGDKAYGEHLQGQAYAIRALAHFDLVKTYGQQHAGGTLGVPYVKEFKGSDLFPSRGTVDSNKADIYADLEAAYSKMKPAYFNSTREYMSKMTAKALESRVAIYFGDYPRAKSAAKLVINSGLYPVMSAANYVSSWAGKGNSNSIFELAFSATDNAGINGLAYIYRTTGGGSYGDVQVIDGVDGIYAATDVRKGILGMEGTMLRNIGKYPNNQGYDNVVVIRIEEVILNYAEALFEEGPASYPAAMAQLNAITSKRGAAAYTTISKADILNERRKELMFEGFRFDDLMRTGTGLVKSSPQQNISATLAYPNNAFAWPIPQSEIDANSNMTQNTGY